MMRMAVLRLSGHCSGEPMDVCAQSNRRMSPASSLWPRNRPRTASNLPGAVAAGWVRSAPITGSPNTQPETIASHRVNAVPRFLIRFAPRMSVAPLPLHGEKLLPFQHRRSTGSALTGRLHVFAFGALGPRFAKRGRSPRASPFLARLGSAGVLSRPKGLFSRNPGCLLLIKLEAGRRLEGVLGGIERQIPGAIFHLGLHGVGWYRNIFLAGAQETADTDYQPGDLAVIADDHIVDGADLVLRSVINTLLVVLGHRLALRGLRHDRSVRRLRHGKPGRSQQDDCCR